MISFISFSTNRMVHLRLILFDFDQPETYDDASPYVRCCMAGHPESIVSSGGIESGVRIVKIPDRTPGDIPIIMVAEVLNHDFPDRQLRGCQLL